MSRDVAPFGLRMQPELKKQVEESATANGRSINAEIVTRLKSSFEMAASFPFPVQQAIDDLREETGCTATEALVHLVLSGQNHGGTVLYATVGPGATMRQFKEMLLNREVEIPDDAAIVVESRS